MHVKWHDWSRFLCKPCKTNCLLQQHVQIIDPGNKVIFILLWDMTCKLFEYSLNLSNKGRLISFQQLEYYIILANSLYTASQLVSATSATLASTVHRQSHLFLVWSTTSNLLAINQRSLCLAFQRFWKCLRNLPFQWHLQSDSGSLMKTIFGKTPKDRKMQITQSRFKMDLEYDQRSEKKKTFNMGFPSNFYLCKMGNRSQ